MSSELSAYAVHWILYLVHNDDHHSRKVKQTRKAPAQWHLQRVNRTWRYVYANYFAAHPPTFAHHSPPPMGYLRSLELVLFLRNGLANEAMRTVFKHGKPLAFDRHHPPLLVPKIVEAFKQLKEEPLFLDVTLSEPSGKSEMTPSELWPQVYIDHLPCGACTKVEGSGRANKDERQIGEHRQESSAKHEQVVVETFHIPSKHFDKRLTLELRFTLGVRDKDAYSDQGCGKSLLLLPEFACEVYGFVDRVHVGTSITASRGLNELIFKLRNRLPPITWSPRSAYWMVLRHFRRDLSYNDRDKASELPSDDGATAYCSLVLSYISNSHFLDFKMPHSDFHFGIKMLAALTNRNFSIDNLQIIAVGGGLSDYRSIDAVFDGGMRLDSLELNLFEHELATLVKTTDFFGMSTVQRLKSFKLVMVAPWQKSEMPRRWAIVNSPLWIAGIHQLRNSECFEVQHESDHHLRAIGHKLVQLCEKFERGEVSELVQHFKFSTQRLIAFRFKNDNMTASKVTVGKYEWDVYRFQNAATGEWLTACVGHELIAYSPYSVLHIVKGYAQPDASFAA